MKDYLALPGMDYILIPHGILQIFLIFASN